jgi:hypothetical protein
MAWLVVWTAKQGKQGPARGSHRAARSRTLLLLLLWGKQEQRHTAATHPLFHALPAA